MGARGRIKADYRLKEIYEYYNKEVIPELQFSEKEYRAIFRDFTDRLRKTILLDASAVELPFLGTFRIRKSKTKVTEDKKHLRIDYYNTRKLGQTIYHLNEHRDGYFYRWKWFKKIFKGKTIRSFVPCRANTRHLANLLKKYDKSKLDYAE